MNAASEPYLSVVVTTRNDDHGGDPLKRLQVLINTFGEQCRRTGLDAEVIVVEWNPPSGRPKVSDLLRLPTHCPFPVRFIEVPPERHNGLRFADVLPLFQMIAKNVGIRRARGRFILATNIDIIFSSELVEYLASRQLSPDRLYRVDRHDIQADYPVDGTLEEQLEYCRTHQIRLNSQWGTEHVDRFGRIRTLDADIVASPGIRLGEGWHVREGDAQSGFSRWIMREARVIVEPSAAGGAMMLHLDVEPNPYQSGSWVEVEVVDGDRRLAHRRVSERTRIHVPLSGGDGQELLVRMLDSSGGRESLPLFERRDLLCFRVCHLSLTVPTYGYDMAPWHPAYDNPRLVVSHSADGVAVSTDPGKTSYCARYGPFEAPADGKYRFQLDFTREEGCMQLHIMDNGSRCWLASSTSEIDDDGFRLFDLSADIARGTSFSLVLANNRAEAGVSQGILRQLLGSVPSAELVPKASESDVTPPGNTPGAQGNTLGNVLFGPFRRMKSAASAVALQKARRFEDRIVDESDRVREMEERIAAQNPLRDLEPLVRLLKTHRPVSLHENACGDFQLLAREHWFSLRGYPEFEMFSMNIDGLFEGLAHAAGVPELTLRMPLCIYHLEHEKGSGWTPEGESLLQKRIAESGITWLDVSAVRIWGTYMQWLGRPMIFNGSEWGFGGVALPEHTLTPAAQGA